MKTICTNIMRETASGAARSAEMERHLAECPDCALFHRISTLEHDSLISLSCEVASGASLIASAYEISNQGVQTI